MTGGGGRNDEENEPKLVFCCHSLRRGVAERSSDGDRAILDLHCGGSVKKKDEESERFGCSLSFVIAGDVVIDDGWSLGFGHDGWLLVVESRRRGHAQPLVGLESGSNPI